MHSTVRRQLLFKVALTPDWLRVKSIPRISTQQISPSWTRTNHQTREPKESREWSQKKVGVNQNNDKNAGVLEGRGTFHLLSLYISTDYSISVCPPHNFTVNQSGDQRAGVQCTLAFLFIFIVQTVSRTTQQQQRRYGGHPPRHREDFIMSLPAPGVHDNLDKFISFRTCGHTLTRQQGSGTKKEDPTWGG